MKKNLKSAITFKYQIVVEHIEFSYFMLLCDKYNP